MHPELKTLLLAGLLALTGCASTIDRDGALAVVPYRIEGTDRIVLDVMLNDQGPFSFALDTGSSITALFDDLSDELELEVDPKYRATVYGVVASGQFQLFNIDRLQVGSEVWADARVAALPGDTLAGATINGLLGIDFLRQYAVGFSAADRVVRLYPPELVRNRSYRGWASVPLDPVSIGASGAALYFVEVQIGGKNLRALFDLGAGLNIINWAAARSIGLDPVRMRHDEVLSGAVDSTPIVAQFSAGEVSTGRVRWRNEKFSVADAEVFEILPQGDGPLAILGSGFFCQREFIIDFVRNRLLIYIAKDEVNEPFE